MPPGGFYTVDRKPNDLRIDKNLNYGFAVRFVFKKIILSLIVPNIHSWEIFENSITNDATCNKSLRFQEDTCILKKVIF